MDVAAAPNRVRGLIDSSRTHGRIMPDHHATPLTPLPAGQRELEEFPRFGLGKFARFYVSDTQPTTFEIRGDVARNIVFDMQSGRLPGVTDHGSPDLTLRLWIIRAHESPLKSAATACHPGCCDSSIAC
jgi:hypothetical protein